MRAPQVGARLHTRARPWSAYLLRAVCSVMMFACAYELLGGSTFALRMRNDLPVRSLVIVASALLSGFPLLMGRKYLGGLIASAFLVAGIGAYWWTTIPWDAYIKDSGFATNDPPTLFHYILVASPAVVVAFYAVVSRPSTLRADLKNRGADLAEIRQVTSASFLSGAMLLVFCGALSFVLWWMMATQLIFDLTSKIPTGVPALVIVGALVTVAYALLSKRVSRISFRRAAGAPADPDVARMSARQRFTRVFDSMIVLRRSR